MNDNLDLNGNFLTYNEYGGWKDVNDCCTNPYGDNCTARWNFDDELIERIANEVIKEMQKKFPFIDADTRAESEPVEDEFVPNTIVTNNIWRYKIKHR